MTLKPLVNYRIRSAKIKEEFMQRIAGLLENEQVRQLDEFRQHYKYTRLRHSMDVAYLSYRITRRLRWDCDAAARAGLLHDLFFHEDAENALRRIRKHPVTALENARKICELSPREENIIIRHMWLLTLIPPKYKEGYVVTFVDKYCAAREFFLSLFTREPQTAAMQVLKVRTQI